MYDVLCAMGCSFIILVGENVMICDLLILMMFIFILYLIIRRLLLCFQKNKAYIWVRHVIYISTLINITAGLWCSG